MSKQSFSLLEGVITVGALVTSAAAVYIAWDQAVTMRVEQHASVLPAIQIDRFEDTSNSGLTIGFTVENAGVGPAFIRKAQLFEGAEHFRGYEEITSSVPQGVDLKYQQLTGRVIAPGVARDAVTLHWRAIAMPQDMVDSAFAATAQWEMEVCYCSTLDRCWVSRSGQREHPHRDDTCGEDRENGLF